MTEEQKNTQEESDLEKKQNKVTEDSNKDTDVAQETTSKVADGDKADDTKETKAKVADEDKADDVTKDTVAKVPEDDQKADDVAKETTSKATAAGHKVADAAKDTAAKAKDLSIKGINAAKQKFEDAGGAEGLKTKGKGFLKFLNKVTKIQPILDRLSNGRIILQTLSVLYKVVAIVLGIALLVAWVMIWQLIDYMYAVIVLFIWQVFFLYASFLVAKILYLKADSIKDYPDSDYVVVPVIAMITKTNGVMILVFLAVMSIPAMIITWFSGGEVPFFSEFAELGTPFFGGIVVFLMCWAIGFMALVLTQLLAEWTLALFSIANDTNILRRNLIDKEKPAVENTEILTED